MLLVGQIMPLKHVCERRRKKRGVPFPHHHKCCISDVCGWEHRALLAVVDLADTRVPSLHCPALICAPTCNPTSCFTRRSKISFVTYGCCNPAARSSSHLVRGTAVRGHPAFYRSRGAEPNRSLAKILPLKALTDQFCGFCISSRIDRYTPKFL